jgi:hypothetical protein
MLASVDGDTGDSEIGDWEMDGSVGSGVPDRVVVVQAVIVTSKQINRIDLILNFLFSLRGIAG